MAIGNVDKILNEAINGNIKKYTELQTYENGKEEKLKFYLPKRYILVFMALLGFVFCYSARATLGVAIVAMTGGGTQNNNSTNHSKNADLDWDLQLQGVLLSLPYYGGIVTQIPLGWLSNKYGGKYFFGGSLLLLAVILLLTPFISQWNIYIFIVVRLLQGIGESSPYPCIMELLSKWIPSQERSKLSSFIFAGAYIGNVIAFPIAGLLAASSLGWPAVFYFFGTVGVIWFIFWTVLVTETPSQHPAISKEEQDFIQSNLGCMKKQENLPIREVFTSAPVWAIGIGYFVEDWGIFTWMSELPTLLDDVYKTHIKSIGMLSSLPFVLLALVPLVAGPCADFMRNRGVDTTFVRKLFSCGAYLIQIVFILLAAHSPNLTMFIILITIAVGIGGFAIAGTGVNALDLAPQYSSLIMGLANSIASLPGLISPSLTGFIINKGGSEQWIIVFYISAGIYLIGAILYFLMASGERQKWADATK